MRTEDWLADVELRRHDGRRVALPAPTQEQDWRGETVRVWEVGRVPAGDYRAELLLPDGRVPRTVFRVPRGGGLLTLIQSAPDRISFALRFAERG